MVRFGPILSESSQLSDGAMLFATGLIQKDLEWLNLIKNIR